MQDYSLKIAETIEDFLRKDDWKFEATDENGIIRFGVSLKCKFRRCNVAIQVRNTCFMVLATLPLTADEESRPNVLEFMDRANYGLIRGGFEMDMSDGEIRYRTSQYCGDEDVLISHETVKDTLYVTLSMVERYGTALLEVMMGNLSPSEAIERSEQS